MSKIKDLKQHFEAMEDMRDIVTALKTLAFMETKKLSRHLADQGRAVTSIRAAAADFLSFYPLLQTDTRWSKTLLIAVGADRGFCGNFNEEIVDAIVGEVQRVGKSRLEIIAVGDRLSAKLEHRVELIESISGATFTEEAPDVLARVVELVSRQIEINQPHVLKVKLVAHQYGSDGLNIIEPLTDLKKSAAPYGSAPNLTLSPGRFFQLLLDQYFQLVFYNVFYSSLMAENTKRIMHLDSALQRLEADAIDFKRQYNQARQEEITEEIELLIMNSQEAQHKDRL